MCCAILETSVKNKIQGDSLLCRGLTHRPEKRFDGHDRPRKIDFVLLLLELHNNGGRNKML